ncbi:hypothetical protein B0H11DRAFT_1909325 [Mycena galericulata]|nr:hypothetical protein B0H11DRAFT_1909325 [Mycena galericulata]
MDSASNLAPFPVNTSKLGRYTKRPRLDPSPTFPFCQQIPSNIVNGRERYNVNDLLGGVPTATPSRATLLRMSGLRIMALVFDGLNSDQFIQDTPYSLASRARLCLKIDSRSRLHSTPSTLITQIRQQNLHLLPNLPAAAAPDSVPPHAGFRSAADIVRARSESKPRTRQCASDKSTPCERTESRSGHCVSWSSRPTRASACAMRWRAARAFGAITRGVWWECMCSGLRDEGACRTSFAPRQANWRPRHLRTEFR